MTRALWLALVKQNASTVAVETAIAQHAARAVTTAIAQHAGGSFREHLCHWI